MDLTPIEQEKQAYYRDARTGGYYGDIWKNVGKCVFCDMRDKYIFYEENGVVMTVLLYAYIDGHLMIIPRRHVKSVKELTPLEWETMRKFMYIAKKLVRSVHGIKGMQILQKDGADAQSTVEHLHFQCVPFDSPNFSVWNYRSLTYTPLESANLYKRRAKLIDDLNHKFEEKYHHRAGLPISCDLILVNADNQILFQERRASSRLVGNYLTPPGGGVQNFDETLESELAREVYEETAIKIDISKIKLLASRIEDLHRVALTDTGAPTEYIDRFLWNTYLLTGFDATTPHTAADDAEELIWIPVKDVANHSRISPGVKAVIKSARL